MVPLAASQALANHLLHQYGKSTLFVKYVMCRMTGTTTESLDQGIPQIELTPTQDVYTIASVADDALFAEEKQNLYIDELKDVFCWSQIFPQISQVVFQPTQEPASQQVDISAIVEWVSEAANTLKHVVEKDSAAGWTSNPRVFMVLTRTIMATNTFVDFLHDKIVSSSLSNNEAEIDQSMAQVVADLEDFMQAAIDNQVHPVLLQTALQRHSLSQRSRLRFAAHASLISPLQSSKASVSFTPISRPHASPSRSEPDTETRNEPSLATAANSV